MPKWHHIITAEPEVRAWVEAHLIAWLDRMPAYEAADRRDRDSAVP
jgi:hypothetical protein